MILLSQALDSMKSRNHRGTAVPFSITFCTADEGKKTGGEIITIEKAVLGILLKNASHADKMRESQANKSAPKRSNSVKKIFDLQAERYYTVHIRLMWEFNNQEICW
jgi:hypothetical protein